MLWETHLQSSIHRSSQGHTSQQACPAPPPQTPQPVCRIIPTPLPPRPVDRARSELFADTKSLSPFLLFGIFSSWGFLESFQKRKPGQPFSQDTMFQSHKDDKDSTQQSGGAVNR